MEKTIKEIFKDYNSESFSLNAGRIKSINLFKKTNKLELIITADDFIKIEDIYKFEQYLKQRFNIFEARTKVEYTKEIDVDLQKEWNLIICYMAHKHPLSKAFLRNSTIEIHDKEITVNMAIKGKMVLDAKKFDEILSNIIEDVYGLKYKITFVENVSADAIKQYMEHAMQLEQEAIKYAEMLAEEERNAAGENEQQQNQKKTQKSATQGKAPSAPQEVSVSIEVPQEKEEENSPLIYGRSLKLKEQLVKIIDLSVDSGKVVLDGEILNIDSRELKSGKVLVMFDLYDGSSTITCKVFSEGDKSKELIGRLKGAKGVKLEGTAQFDPFAKELGVIANVIIESTGLKKQVRMDNAKEKRVELHMHTQMSQMDGMTSATDLLKRAAKWGMKSIAITDHGVVQAFPEAHHFCEKNPDLKVIYGVEAYLAPDRTPVVSFPKGQDLDTTYCVLDLETTGFSFRTEKITEIGIMKIKNGEVLDEFSCFVNPEKPIPQRVVEVTNITDDMVKDAETIDKVFPKMMDFIGDSVLVAHNADFDIGFLKYNATQLGYTLNNTYLDTLRLAKELFPDYKKYKLGIIAENLGIKVEVAHRA